GAIIREILGNTVFMAGLLAFIMTYLLRSPNRGQLFDGIVGGVLGLIAWACWVYVLQNDWPWWTAPLVIAAGAAIFISLRFMLRQIARLVKLRSEEHTSELQSRENLVCRLLLEKKTKVAITT